MTKFTRHWAVLVLVTRSSTSRMVAMLSANRASDQEADHENESDVDAESDKQIAFTSTCEAAQVARNAPWIEALGD
jgi:hypothetical protein